MYSFQFTSSASSSSHCRSTVSLRSRARQDQSIPTAPQPETLNSVTDLPASRVNVSRVHAPAYLNPLLLPPMINWLHTQLGDPPTWGRPVFSAHCSSSPGGASETSGTESSGAATRAAGRLLHETAQCVRKHGLLKSAQQLRDDELYDALVDFLPRVLIEIVRPYAPELVLSPLTQSRYCFWAAMTETGDSWEKILNIFFSDDPETDFFRNDIAVCHGHMIPDQFIGEAVKNLRDERVVAAQKNKHPGTLQKRDFDFRKLTRFLTSSQCDALVARELSVLAGKGETCSDRDQISHNIGLLTHVKKMIKPESEKIRRHRELECGKADLLLQQFNEFLKIGEHSKAYSLFLKAVQLLCQHREKRRVIELMTRLIEMCHDMHSADFPAIVDFFRLTKQLCLSYPIDITSHANLLFTMDSVCRRHSQLKLMNELHQEILKDHDLILPPIYRLKLRYVQVLAEVDSGLPITDTLPHLNKAITQFYIALSDTNDQNDPPAIRTADLSRVEYLHSFAATNGLLSRIATDQIDRFEQMTFQQQQDCAALFFGLPADTPFDKLVQVATSALHQSLAFLNEAHSMKLHRELTENLYVYYFDKLVGIYLKAGNVNYLETFLAEHKVRDSMQYSGFKSALQVWRTSLQSMKEQTDQAEQID